MLFDNNKHLTVTLINVLQLSSTEIKRRLCQSLPQMATLYREQDVGKSTWRIYIHKFQTRPHCMFMQFSAKFSPFWVGTPSGKSLIHHWKEQENFKYIRTIWLGDLDKITVWICINSISKESWLCFILGFDKCPGSSWINVH